LFFPISYGRHAFHHFPLFKTQSNRCALFLRLPGLTRLWPYTSGRRKACPAIELIISAAASGVKQDAEFATLIAENSVSSGLGGGYNLAAQHAGPPGRRFA
jgi:hypothetical protein